ncbi:hypothetical protein PIIN_00129 [Serendipita indica DSM 11827]|uniref:RING-CH-type domain-containing protein n=1 Tax=Serendipita indica (strain DSM 11827) TaxID=1109443 RepID=G4T550_SERID|nr:hypothetical protein PIIN_00129 [Serendipita indica DSM 11827]
MAQVTTARPRRSHRVPTISDIRVKKCWICLEVEVYGESEASADWCHPCKCSLMCHGKCLLDWIASQEQNTTRAGGPIKCPQCGTEYTVVSYQPTLLKVFDAIHTRIVLLGAAWGITGLVVTAAGTVVLLGCFYGSEAFSAFVGKQCYDLMVGDDSSKWPVWLWFDFGAIPWTLYNVGYNRSFLFNFSSIICAFPFSVAAPHGEPEGPFIFPPSPFASLAILPFLISARNAIYDRLSAWVTLKAARPIHDRSLHKEIKPGSRNVSLHFLNFRRRRVRNVEGQQAPVIRAGQVAAAAAQQGRMAGPVGDNINRVLRGSRIGSAFIKPLLTPWIAKYMGSILLSLSDRFPFLKPMLGLRSRSMPIILYKGLRTVGLQQTWRWNDLDPVWWRNTLGLSVFSVCYDGLQLWYTYLIERERLSRRIVSRSFEGIDINELDLISGS